MGVRSRERRARRGWIVPWIMPGLRTLTQRVQRQSLPDAYRLGCQLGAWFERLKPNRETLHQNLRVACGRDLDKAERRAFEHRYYRHLGLSLVELAKLPTVTPARFSRFFEPGDDARIREVYDEGRGLICVVGHSGQWEMAGHLAGVLGMPITTTAKFSGYPQLDEFMLGLRASLGQRLIPAKGSMWAQKKALGRGEAVGINADQEARQNPVFAPFFGVPAATVSSPAQLHVRSKSPIVVVAVHRVGAFRYRTTLFDVIRHEPAGDRAQAVQQITERVNLALEASIRLYPEQWLWGHRRWRRRPEGEAEPFARITDALPLDPRGTALASERVRVTHTHDAVLESSEGPRPEELSSR
ncbi:MAG: hypothetical protein R3F62_09400 [Planctomycetota bacterium]